MPDKADLRQRQALPLSAKILMSQNRIREWYQHFNGDVCVSFSGGKDSTVLAHLVHNMYPEVPLVFCNTGLEYPEIQAFAKKMGAEFIRPKMSFSEVISTYWYPIISKENAEAIHYARKIRNGGGQTAERKRRELNGERTAGVTEIIRGGAVTKLTEEEQTLPHPGTPLIHGGGVQRNSIQTSELHRDTVSMYQGRTGWRRATLTGKPLTGGGVLTTTDQNADAIKREVRGIHRRGSTDWHGWRRNCIAGVGDFDETKSIFNKEKWLPLCRDTLFKISHQCCGVMKKSPLGIYQRKHKIVPYLGTLAEESRLREQAWLRHGCNAYDGHKQTSQPLSFWLEQDILHYIKQEGLEIASVYGDIVAVDDDGYQYEPMPGMDCTLKCTGCNRTGCVFCGFGVHSEKGETRFQRLARTHPKQYEYCMNGGQWVDNPDYDPAAPKMDGDWVNWNPKKIWIPSKKGLGMKKVFDDCNQIYGKDFIRYD